MEREIIDLQSVVGKGYGTFFRDKHRYRVLKGGKGSKKSATTALNFIYRISTTPYSNLLVVRQVYNTHRDSTFAQLKWAIERLGQKDMWDWTVSPLEIVFHGDEGDRRIIFRGFDDALKIASTTVPNGYLCWVWVEEAFEIQSEDAFDKLDMSVPRGNVPDFLFKQTTLTFNPWSASHWLKKKFFDTPSDDVSTYTTNYLCNEFLDETDRQLYERMKIENPRKYDVAGLGNWGMMDGLVYENWEIGDDPAVYDEKSEDYDDWQWRDFFGLDYGYTNDPTAFIRIRVNPIKKFIYIMDEFYKTKMLNVDIAKEVIRRGYAKEIIRADCAEPKSNDDLRRLGLRRIRGSVKGRDSILNGIDTIQSYRIIVSPMCKNAISELSTYCWEVGKDESGINKPCDHDNHLMDAMRYAFNDVDSFHPTLNKRAFRYDRTNININDIAEGWA